MRSKETTYLNAIKTYLPNDTKVSYLMAALFLWVELNPCIDQYGASGNAVVKKVLALPLVHYFRRQENTATVFVSNFSETKYGKA